MDQQKPKDTFFFEQEGAFVVRLLMSSQTGSKHVLSEFTKEDVESMIAGGPALREARASAKTGSGDTKKK
jgi:hypothetical protein